MKRTLSGSLTIVLALTMVVFLTFCMVLVEGVRAYFVRMEAMQAMELTEYSVLSEFQQELFAQYGLFFLDLDYEQGCEMTAVLGKRAEKYLTKNSLQTETAGIEVGKIRRATDGQGLSFFQQAVAVMKLENGYRWLEELLELSGEGEHAEPDVEALLGEQISEAEGILAGAVDEKERPLWDISLPKISYPSVDSLTQAVFGDESVLSDKQINLKERIKNRQIEKGSGVLEERNFSDMQQFHKYLFAYCSHYGSEEETFWMENLEYQIEYIIFGQESDKENLENMMWRIFLLRSGGNYLFYHQDGEKIAVAEAEAIAIAGASANPALIKAVREILLITQAIEDGVEETKRIFAGERVPFYQQGVFSGIEIGYEEYLYLLLSTTGAKEKIYRCMDVIELEVRTKSGYEKFRFDHCTDNFELVWTYQYESLFLKIPLLEQHGYENTMVRNVNYEN